MILGDTHQALRSLRHEHGGPGDPALGKVGQRPVGVSQSVLRRRHLDVVPAGEIEKLLPSARVLEVTERT